MDTQNLSHCPLFKGIPEPELQKLLAGSFAKTRVYSPDSLIAMRGESCTQLMIVLKGAVQGQMIDDNGKMVVIEDIPAPRPLAIAFLYAGQNEFPVNIVATTDAQILFIPKAEFTDMLQKNKVLLQNFLQAISDRSRFLSEKIMFLSFKSLKGKIAEWLLQKAEAKQSNTIHIAETQQELADLFGVARPSLARAMKELENEGLITAQHKQLTIVDKGRLRKL